MKKLVIFLSIIVTIFVLFFAISLGRIVYQDHKLVRTQQNTLADIQKSLESFKGLSDSLLVQNCLADHKEICFTGFEAAVYQSLIHYQQVYQVKP